MNLKVIKEDFSVCKLNNLDNVNYNDEFVFVSKTDDELSLVCSTNSVPEDCIKVEHNWKALKIEGELDFSLVGILAKIATILADNKISIFAISTYNTDYILVKADKLDNATSVLAINGYTIG